MKYGVSVKLFDELLSECHKYAVISELGDEIFLVFIVIYTLTKITLLL